jgi:hypothetical protein
MLDKIIKTIGFPANVSRFWNFLRDNATITKKTAITTERTAVAKVESTFFKPIFPNIATSEANTADPTA